jgi:membrane protease YdiL (CAAX protease family)
VSDDLTGPPPPTPPHQPPVFLQPDPLKGAEPPRHDPPGEIPPTAADAWPWFFGFLVLVFGFVGVLVVTIPLLVIWKVAGGKSPEDAGFVFISTVAQAFVFIGTAYGLARTRGPAGPREFGLLRARFWPTVGKMAAVMASYLVLLATYTAIVHLTADKTADKLGAGSGTLGMIGFVILVTMIAPISEEIFFRGMIFRSFANSWGVWLGAIASGLMFGALHIDSFKSDRLLQVVPLALLGIMFALLYAWSGTLYSTIALHATNNTLAAISFASDKHSQLGVTLSIVMWLLMMTFCATGWMVTDNPKRRPAAAPLQPPPPAQPPPPVGPPSYATDPPPFQQPQPPPGPQYPPPPNNPDFPWGQP